MSSAIQTGTERVPASVAGAIRTIRPTCGCATPSIFSTTSWPVRTAPTSAAGTGASISIRERSTIDITRPSTGSFSPGCAKRSATMPSIGATSSASDTDLRASASCAAAASRLPIATSSVDCAWSSALCDTKLRSLSWRVVSTVRRACATCESADFSWASRSRTRTSNSIGSIRPITCPRFTVIPSRTRNSRISPGTLAFTTVCSTGRRVPVSGRVRAIDEGATATMSLAANSIGASAGAADAAAAPGAAGVGARERISQPPAASAPATTRTVIRVERFIGVPGAGPRGSSAGGWR